MAPEEYRDAIQRETHERLEELGQHRAASYLRSVNQAKRFNSNDNSIDNLKYRFEINDWVKIRNNAAQKFQNKWIGPLIVVEYGHPGTYWLMYPDGKRLDNTVNQERLAPWIENSEYSASNNADSNRDVSSSLGGDNVNELDSETLDQSQTPTYSRA